MSNKEVLIKAVTRAIANGWTVGDWTDADDFSWHIGRDEWGDLALKYTGMGEEFEIDAKFFLFNHDFAKALWGEKLIGIRLQINTFDGVRHEDKKLTYWQYHLQQMVIAEEPIAYLGQNI